MHTSLLRCSMPSVTGSTCLHKHACSSAAAGGRGVPVLANRLAVRRNVRTSFRVSEPADTKEDESHPRETSPVQRAQDPVQPQQQQQHLHPPNPFPLKYAQMGHSKFGRGAPHVCYSQVGDSGVFYIKPEVDELLDDWQQWLEQQQRQHQQHWQQQRQQLQAWARAQSNGKRQVPLQGWGFRSADTAASPALYSHAAAAAASANSRSSASASNDAASGEGKHQQSLRDSMLSSTAAGGVGVVAALAAAAAAALNIGNNGGGSGNGGGSSGGGGSSSNSSSGGAGPLNAAGPGPFARVQHLLLGMTVGVVGLVLMMLYCKTVLAALLLCYAGFALGM